MAATEVCDHPIPFEFPPILADVFNDDDFDFNLIEIEDYFARQMKNIDDTEVMFDEKGRICGVIFHKFTDVDPRTGITLQFERALKFLLNWLRRCLL